MNTLLTVFENRSFGVSPPKDNRGQAGVVVNGESIGFSIEERVRQQPHRLTDEEKADQRRYSWSWAPVYDHVPTGELSLKIDTGYGSGLRSTWSDRATRKVEDCLNEFIVGLVRVAERERAARQHREEETLRREIAIRMIVNPDRIDTCGNAFGGPVEPPTRMPDPKLSVMPYRVGDGDETRRAPIAGQAAS